MKPTGIHLIAEFINCPRDVLDDQNLIENSLKLGIEAAGLTLVQFTGYKFDPIGVTVIAVISESHIAIHTYPEAGHANIDIHTCSTSSTKPGIVLDYLKQCLKPGTCRMVEVVRGNPLTINQKDWITSWSAYGFEVRYHISRLIEDLNSQFQRIQIIENDNFGKMLFLDNDLQVSQFDVEIYNRCLVEPLIDHFSTLGGDLAAVLILGGGDGGVLQHLLQYPLNRAVVCEIDQQVIDACRRHLPEICGTSFEDSRVELVIADAQEFLKPVQAEYSAIIYDLTMHPEGFTAATQEEFLATIFSKIQNALLPGGIATFQCCSEFDLSTQQLIQKLLPEFFDNCRFERVFIPSFCETWVFAAGVKLS